MAIVALPALATAMLTRQYEEIRSLVSLELGALRPHAPVPAHPYAKLLEATLKDFRVMTRDEIWSWTVALIGPLDEARRETDREWEWMITREIDAACRVMQGRR